MTSTQTRDLLAAVLIALRDGMGRDTPIRDLYDGACPEECETLAEAAIWLRLNIESVKVRK